MATRRTQHVELRAVFSSDYDYLYSLLCHPDIAFRCRYRGSPPRPDLFARDLWEGALAGFAIVSTEQQSTCGIAIAYNADLRSRHVYGALVVDPRAPRGWGVEAAELFVDELFTRFELRKIYFECLDFNLGQFASGIGPWLIEEGRLTRHELFGGRYCDVHILALHRDCWQQGALTGSVESRVQSAGPVIRDPTAFCTFLREALSLDGVVVTPATELDRDLGLDSLGRFELIVLLEELAGRAMPEGVAHQLVCVRDALAFLGVDDGSCVDD